MKGQQAKDINDPSIDVDDLNASIDGKITPMDVETGTPDGPSPPSLVKRLRVWLSFLGPSWLVCSAFIDPGCMVSDFQQGAYTGYQLLWITFGATITGIVFQTLAFRLGLGTGKNLAQLCREHYKSRATSRAVWIVMELCVIITDVQAVVGPAIALSSLTGCPFWASILVILALTFVVVIFYQFWANQTEYFVAFLIIGLIVCFGVDFFQVLPPAGKVFHGWWVADAEPYTLFTGLGILGALIAPNVIYLHSDLVINHKFPHGASKKTIFWTSFAELVSSMLFTFFGNLMIIGVFANAFFSQECAAQGLANFQNNCTAIVLDSGLDDLAAGYGPAFQVFFLIGLVASGLGSMINGTLSGVTITEGFLNIKLKFWQRLLITRVITLIPTMLLAILPGSGSEAASILNEWINVLLNMVLPFALIPVIYFSRKDFLGDWKIHVGLYYILWLANWLIISINIYVLVGFIFLPNVFGDSPGTFPEQPWFYSFIGAFLIMYAYLIVVTLSENFSNLWHMILKIAIKYIPENRK